MDKLGDTNYWIKKEKKEKKLRTQINWNLHSKVEWINHLMFWENKFIIFLLTEIYEF